MSSVVPIDGRRALRVCSASASGAIEIVLLGCGTVGSAIARLVRDPHGPFRAKITTALVRDARRTRPALAGDALRTSDGGSALAGGADVVVEVLGGREPARTLVLDALARGIPVVTANKSLVAAHGRELREAARATATPLLYEAAVLAGVPFLGTFARRPHAARLTGVAGIANGTSNYLLTRAAAERIDIGAALADAQRLGLAEPDPANDVGGIDAAEKLAVLLQHFAGADVTAGDIETAGIERLGGADVERAHELGGVIKPIVLAEWHDGVEAFVGPAFVPRGHVLAEVNGAENAVVLTGARGRLVFRGPGAGPDVTAATVLDDVREALRPGADDLPQATHRVTVRAPETGWLISASAARLPHPVDVADLLASHGVYLQRTGARRVHHGLESVGALTWPAGRGRLEAALAALASATGCRTTHLRALEG